MKMFLCKWFKNLQGVQMGLFGNVVYLQKFTLKEANVLIIITIYKRGFQGHIGLVTHRRFVGIQKLRQPCPSVGGGFLCLQHF